jgi:hypothetical protein
MQRAKAARPVLANFKRGDFWLSFEFFARLLNRTRAMIGNKPGGFGFRGLPLGPAGRRSKTLEKLRNGARSLSAMRL